MKKYGFKVDFSSLVRLVEDVTIPPMYKVRQKFDSPGPIDTIQELDKELKKKRILGSLKGKKVCIAVGSRGIKNLACVVAHIVKAVKEEKGDPFIIPAMGSHGGATPEGQKKVLEELDITEEKMGVPIVSSLEVELLGHTGEGIPVYVSKDALYSDAVILVNRVKPHTSFRGDVESGLIKMAVIGLGKQKGADLCHKMGFYRFADRLKAMAEIVLSRVPIVFGVALVENAYDETAEVRVLEAGEFFIREPELLQKAKAWMPRIWLNDLDVLVVDELGKDISGDGMDPNITGRFASDYAKGDLKVDRIVVLRLTGRTEGNANGIGMADITTLKVLEDTDFSKGYINAITAALPRTVRLPLVMPDDRSAIKAAIKTANNLDYVGKNTRMVRIKNTLELQYIYVSEALIEEVIHHPHLEIVEGPLSFEFDSEGRLLTWW